jgi:hypothetical protein
MEDLEELIIAMWVKSQLTGGNTVTRYELMKKFSVSGFIEIDELEESLERYNIYRHMDLPGTPCQQTTYRYET